MGLKIRLRPNERMIVNGCVVTNGDRRNTITVSSFGQVIRSNDILQADEATTPLRRLYFCIQTMLIDANKAEEYMTSVNKLSVSIYHLLESEDERADLMEAMNHLHRRDFYKALRTLRNRLKSDETCDDAIESFETDDVILSGARAFEDRVAQDAAN